MTYVILFILAVVWAVYLANWLRTRTETTRSNSISSFARHMNTLQRATPRTGLAVAPRVQVFPGSTSFAPVRPTLSPVKQRRRTVLFSLLGSTGVLFLASVAMGGAATTLFVLSLLLTGAYITLLANAQKRVLEQRAKVRRLPSAERVSAERIDFFSEDRSEEVATAAPHLRAVGSR